MSKAAEPVVAPGGEPRALALSGALDLTQAITAAASKGKDGVEVLERLVALQERVMEKNAAAEFFDAMVEFRKKCPMIRKTSAARDLRKDGAPIMYRYAELDSIVQIVDPLLLALGLTFSWDSACDEKGFLSCTCKIRHRNGHVETATFACPVGEGTSIMSKPQKTAATLTYAKRQSLVQALGLTMTEDDTDAREEDEPANVEKITPQQEANLKALLDEIGNGEENRLLRGLRILKLCDVPADKFAGLVKFLEAKRR